MNLAAVLSRSYSKAWLAMIEANAVTTATLCHEVISAHTACSSRPPQQIPVSTTSLA